jgi:Kef-type K+ transport system membrane component KefB
MFQASRLKTFALYAGLAAAGAAAFFLIRSAGANLQGLAEAAPSPAARSVESFNLVFRALLALVVIIVAARAFGVAFRAIGQPAVIGEIVGGVFLGPSFLGAIAPGVHAQLLPPQVMPFLVVHAQLGVILYMFVVGLELDLAKLARTGHATLAISHASIVVPFVLGSALALVLYPRLSPDAVSFTMFALFIGTSLSITAFPVLARILTDLGMARSDLGVLALTCAAINDVTAWCLLALVVGIARAETASAAWAFTLTLAFIALMLRLGVPAVRRFTARLDAAGHIGGSVLTGVLVAMFASAMTTEFIGIHGLFGAFLFGAIIPHRSRLASEMHERLGDFVGVIFLPAFFAFTGMRTEIGLIRGGEDWLLCGAIIIVACAGKFGGTVLAARWSGIQWRDSAALGALMNTRGLVELIVLNIGLDLGIISPRLFAMLVLMALTTTFMATPVLRLLLTERAWSGEETQRSARGGR